MQGGGAQVRDRRMGSGGRVWLDPENTGACWGAPGEKAEAAELVWVLLDPQDIVFQAVGSCCPFGWGRWTWSPVERPWQQPGLPGMRARI